MFSKMVIMDSENAKVIFCQLPHNQEPEDLIADMQLSAENCQWMVETEKHPIVVEW